MSSFESELIRTNLNNYIDKLDAADGSSDGKLTSDNWNRLAEAIGGYYIPDGKKIRADRAKSEVSEILNGDTEDLRQKQQKFLDYAQVASKAGYKIGGEMLRISLQKGALTPGRHGKDNYTVYTPTEAQSKFEEIGLSDFYAEKSSKEDRRLKLVMFDPDSIIAKGTQSSVTVVNAVKQWYSEGAKEGARITLTMFDTANWHTADDMDLGLGVGSCYLLGLHDNGDGTVSGYIEDVYDYDPLYHGTQMKQVTDAVNTACELQKAGKLHRYRTLVPITVTVGNKPGQRTQQSQAPHAKPWSQKMKDAVRPFTTQSQRESLSGAASVGSAVVDGVESAIDAAADAGEWVIDKGKEGVDYVGRKAKVAWKTIKDIF